MTTNDTMTVHPVARIRARLGLSRAAFGALCGVSEIAVYYAEDGRTASPRRIADALDRHGIANGAELIRDCAQWRQARAARLAAERQATTRSMGDGQ